MDFLILSIGLNKLALDLLDFEYSLFHCILSVSMLVVSSVAHINIKVRVKPKGLLGCCTCYCKNYSLTSLKRKEKAVKVTKKSTPVTFTPTLPISNDKYQNKTNKNTSSKSDSTVAIPVASKVEIQQQSVHNLKVKQANKLSQVVSLVKTAFKEGQYRLCLKHFYSFEPNLCKKDYNSKVNFSKQVDEVFSKHFRKSGIFFTPPMNQHHRSHNILNNHTNTNKNLVASLLQESKSASNVNDKKDKVVVKRVGSSNDSSKDKSIDQIIKTIKTESNKLPIQKTVSPNITTRKAAAKDKSNLSLREKSINYQIEILYRCAILSCLKTSQRTKAMDILSRINYSYNHLVRHNNNFVTIYFEIMDMYCSMQHLGHMLTTYTLMRVNKIDSDSYIQALISKNIVGVQFMKFMDVLWNIGVTPCEGVLTTAIKDFGRIHRYDYCLRMLSRYPDIIYDIKDRDVHLIIVDSFLNDKSQDRFVTSIASLDYIYIVLNRIVEKEVSQCFGGISNVWVTEIGALIKEILSKIHTPQSSTKNALSDIFHDSSFSFQNNGVTTSSTMSDEAAVDMTLPPKHNTDNISSSLVNTQLHEQHQRLCKIYLVMFNSHNISRSLSLYKNSYDSLAVNHRNKIPDIASANFIQQPAKIKENNVGNYEWIETKMLESCINCNDMEFLKNMLHSIILREKYRVNLSTCKYIGIYLYVMKHWHESIKFHKRILEEKYKANGDQAAFMIRMSNHVRPIYVQYISDSMSHKALKT